MSDSFNIDIIPENIKNLIKPEVSWYPVFGTVEIPANTEARVNFKITYQSPPTILLTVMDSKKNQNKITNFGIPNVTIPKTAIAKIENKPLSFSLPPISVKPLEIGSILLDEIKNFDLSKISFQGLTELTNNFQAQGLSFLQTIKNNISFSLPPKISTWNVEWHRMVRKGAYSSKTINGTAGTIVESNKTNGVYNKPSAIKDVSEKVASQFTGMFDYDFGKDSIFGGISEKIGFKAQAEIYVENEMNLNLIAFGSESYFVLIDGVKIVHHKNLQGFSLPKTLGGSITLKPGTHIIQMFWYNWKGGLPSIGLQTFPPLIPNGVGKFQIDLEAGLELANLSVWFLMRDAINSIYHKYLPTISFSIPKLSIAKKTLYGGKTIGFNISSYSINIGFTKYEVFKGYSKSWSIPKIEIPAITIFPGLNFSFSLATPFKYVNKLIFNALSFFPAWIGRIQGREMGKHITSAIASITAIIENIFDTIKSSVEGIITYVNELIDTVEDNIKQLGKDLQETITEVSESVTEVAKETFDKITTIHSDVEVMAVQLTEAVNSLQTNLVGFKDDLSTSINKNNKKMIESIQTSIQETFNSSFNTLKASIETNVSDVFEKVNVLQNKQLNEMNTYYNNLLDEKLNFVVKFMTDSINGTLNTIIPAISQEFGVDLNQGLAQANPKSIAKDHFIIAKNRYKRTINYVAIGIPDNKFIPDISVDIL